MPPQASIPAIKVDVMDHPVPIPDQALSGRWSPVMSAGSICGAFRPRQSPGLLVSAGQSTDGVPLVNVFTSGTPLAFLRLGQRLLGTALVLQRHRVKHQASRE